MKKKYFIPLFCVLLLACQSKKSTNETSTQKEILISLDEDRCYDMSQFLSYHSFVVLESTNESIIGEINKIQLSNNRILPLDPKQGTIFIFDSQWTYISKIAKKGRGHGEYINADDFYHDAQTDHIYVYDGLSGKVVEYDMQASLITSFSLAKGRRIIKVTDKGDWLLYKNNKATSLSKDQSFNNLLIYDRDWNKMKELLPFNKYLLGRSYGWGHIEPVFSFYDSKLYILPSLSDKIYVYDSESHSIEPFCSIRFKGFENHVINEYMKEKPLRELMSKMLKGEVPGFINNFYKDGEMLSFQFNYKDSKAFLMCFYNTSTGETKVCDFMYDDNGLSFTPATYWSQEGNMKVLSVLKGSLFESDQRKNPDNEVIRAISAKIGKLSEMNPVLVFYSIKK